MIAMNDVLCHDWSLSMVCILDRLRRGIIDLLTMLMAANGISFARLGDAETNSHNRDRERRFEGIGYLTASGEQGRTAGGGMSL